MPNKTVYVHYFKLNNPVPDSQMENAKTVLRSGLFGDPSWLLSDRNVQLDILKFVRAEASLKLHRDANVKYLAALLDWLNIEYTHIKEDISLK